MKSQDLSIYEYGHKVYFLLTWTPTVPGEEKLFENDPKKMVSKYVAAMTLSSCLK